jgi:hypothetical protein
MQGGTRGTRSGSKGEREDRRQDGNVGGRRCGPDGDDTAGLMEKVAVPESELQAEQAKLASVQQLHRA